VAEKIIDVTSVDPIVLYGVNDYKLERIRTYFPKLKLIARGDQLKAIGDGDEIQRFEAAIQSFLKHFNKYGALTEAHIENLLQGTGRRQ
jgi:phosphate starvation-inducible protein PhoH and related proteins